MGALCVIEKTFEEIPQLVPEGNVRRSIRASPTGSDDEEERSCRICLQGASASRKVDPFLSPCRCKGSQRWVHRACLQQWQCSVLGEPNSTRAIRCSVCGTLFSCGLLDSRECIRRKLLRGCRLRSKLFEATLSVGFFLAVAVATLLVLDAPEVQTLQRGCLLVATDQIRTGTFHRSVVLMVEHSRWGAMGFIINRPLHSQNDMKRALQGIKTSNIGILEEGLGGPVQVDETIAHLSADNVRLPAAEQVLDGVWWQQETRQSREAFRGDRFVDHSSRSPYIRLHGYAGWAPRQLEMEIDRGSWRIFTNATQAIVFGDSQNLWENLAKALDADSDASERYQRSTRTSERWLNHAIKVSETIVSKMKLALKEAKGSLCDLSGITIA